MDEVHLNQVLSSASIKKGATRESVYLTLLALYILEEAFADKEDEWQLIAGKAKSWLNSAGIPKPAALVRKFNFKVT